jgi:spore maturation protein CgeB
MNKDIEKMFYYSEDDLGDKIKYYLEHEEEREEIAKRVFNYIFKNHTYDNRANLILSKINI